ncbi:polysaccharide deacetylase family protein [Nocardia sp. NEAU-351]|uniref:Polysaccharide deacetylase family protein n=2 Tax=Nocardia bovistercoris TaxID=2785916 RepID=A0A931IJ44_9NOCA|nr:polysaccharide deacetylase family protein [Nocardia bovistercoris]
MAGLAVACSEPVRADGPATAPVTTASGPISTAPNRVTAAPSQVTAVPGAVSPLPGTAAAAPGVAAPISAPLRAPLPLPAAVAGQHEGAAPRLWGTQMPGIVDSFAANGDQIALTLDACGGAGNNDMDQDLIDFLIAERIPCTLFLNKRWIDADPARVLRLAGNPLFELANHGVAHRPLSVNGRSAYGIAGTASAWEAADEVWVNHLRLAELTGVPPRLFRAGTAHYDEVAVAIATELGETPIGFSVNADRGATASAAQVAATVSAAWPGSITLAHMHRPRSGTGPGMVTALTALRQRGFTFVRL